MSEAVTEVNENTLGAAPAGPVVGGFLHKLPRRRLLSRAMCSDLAALSTIIVVTLAGALAVPIALEYSTNAAMRSADALFFVASALVVSLVFTEAVRQGGYFQFDRLPLPWASLRGIVWRWGLTLVAFISVLYALGATDRFPRMWLFAWASFATVGLIAHRFMFASAVRSLTVAGGSLSRRIVVVGEGARVEAFLDKARDEEMGLEVMAQITVSEIEGAGSAFDDRIRRLCAERGLDDLILCTGEMDPVRLETLMSRLHALPVHVAVCPDTPWLDRGSKAISTFGSFPVLTLQRQPIDGWASFVKMLGDKVVGLGLFIFALPLLTACAIAVRLDSPGPIFFIQHRQGFAGEVFPIFKFRTMRVMENGHEVRQATKDDDRVTRVGRILRRTSLDELPQLWNVLRGDMSLVGPRPHAIAHDVHYGALIRDYAVRRKVKPGITGWAQVNGYRGETRDDAAMEARIRYDLAYIDRWSVWFDLRILIMTVGAVLAPKNAY